MRVILHVKDYDVNLVWTDILEKSQLREVLHFFFSLKTLHKEFIKEPKFENNKIKVFPNAAFDWSS